MINYWKIYVLLFLVLSLGACNDDDDGVYANYHYVVTEIDSIQMVDSAQLGQPIRVTTYTGVKDGCQQFETIDYHILGNERTVATIAIEFEDVECGDTVTIDPCFYFEPERRGTFTFRFWAGRDEVTEEDVFITKDILIQ